MSATVETQRLISVSLGKIAQSRGQRGGINLHKNLLVATVLHKARAAYMIETFNYQQQQQMSLQQQKTHDEQMLRLHQQQQHQQHVVPEAPVEQICEASCESEVGHCSLASAVQGSTQEITVPAPALCEQSSSEHHVGQQCEQVSESKSPEHMLARQCEYISPEPVMVQECEHSVSIDKENTVPNPVSTSQCAQDSLSSDCDHLDAANRLSQEAALGLNSSSDSSNFSSCQLQNAAPMSGSTTCTGILKRRRDNSNSHTYDIGSSVSKKARILESAPSSITKSSPFFASFTSEASDYSSDESEAESDAESDVCPVPMHTETTQISNLVNIFNSGFSGLCAGELSSSSESDYDCDFEATAPPQYTTLTQLRQESAVPNKATFSRSMSEPSLMCSTEVGRLDSLPSAIVLSA